jgi:CheY-like chemotaxis protein
MESLSEVKVCEEAVNGSDGLRKALELKPDLIVLDFRMPEMDGLEMAKVLRQRIPSVTLILYAVRRCRHRIERTCFRHHRRDRQVEPR